MFSPRLVNELRLAYNHFNFGQTFETEASGVVYWKNAGLKNLDEGYAALPAILTGTQYSSIGNGGSVPFLNISDMQHYVEHLTFTAGKHSLKMGVDFRRGRNTDISGFQGNGVITFNGEYSARNPTLQQVKESIAVGISADDKTGAAALHPQRSQLETPKQRLGRGGGGRYVELITALRQRQRTGMQRRQWTR